MTNYKLQVLFNNRNKMKVSNSDHEIGSVAQTVVAELSPVNQMFDGRSVFITGASGFIGRVLLEKLLRSYQGIKNVYILMRPKKHVQPIDRLNNQLLNAPIFDKIRSMKNGAQLLAKIIVISGDISDKDWAISDDDLNRMLTDPSLSIIFHSAATVRFDEPLKTSIQYNLIAIDTLIKLCRRLPNLIALCHVSSAYVNSHIKNSQDIQEQLYPLEYSPSSLIKMSLSMDQKLMQHIKPLLVGDRPNTYTYTKALGEHLIAAEAADLPVTIMRPSIVVASWKEPIPGWIDNLNGPTGLVLAYGKGLMRSLQAVRECKADIVPVDIVINSMIASAYYVAVTSGKLDNNQIEIPKLETVSSDTNINDMYKFLDVKDNVEVKRVPPIFHCTSGDLNPFTWGRLEKTLFGIIENYPYSQILRYPGGSFKRYAFHDKLTRLFVHFLPALIIDLLCMIMGKKHQLLSIYEKLHSAMEALTHFASTNYEFKSKNIGTLQAMLSHPIDREQLYMDITKVDWDAYWKDYVLGTRRFLLKESDHTLEESRRSFRRAYYKEFIFRIILTALAFYCLMPLGSRILKGVTA